jgi:hypothetical protein
MAALVGLVLALAVGAYAAAMRLDRDRAFYPVVLIVVASYWVLFAAMSGSTRVILLEASFAGVFVVAASIGFKRSLWLVAAGLAAHGVFDVFHSHLVVNPGMPEWWPAFCSTYDVVAAAVLAGLLLRRAPAIAPRAVSTSTRTVA